MKSSALTSVWVPWVVQGHTLGITTAEKIVPAHGRLPDLPYQFAFGEPKELIEHICQLHNIAIGRGADGLSLYGYPIGPDEQRFAVEFDVDGTQVELVNVSLSHTLLGLQREAVRLAGFPGLSGEFFWLDKEGNSLSVFRETPSEKTPEGFDHYVRLSDLKSTGPFKLVRGQR